MKLYLVNNLQQNEFDILITLLDYTTPISECLKSIKLPSDTTKKLLIDTILCSGMNGYRFIEATLNKDGTINLNNYAYVNVSNNIIEEANKILKDQPAFLENSVLPKSQIEKILQY